MTLAFHYHTPAIQINDEIFMPAYIGLFIDSIAPFFDNLICFLHSPNDLEKNRMDYSIQSSNVFLIGIGPHNSIPKRMMNSKITAQIFKKHQSSCDLLLLRASTPLLPIIKKTWKKPIALLLVSDATSGLDNLPQPLWRKTLIKLWAHWYSKQELKLAKKSLTIVNSQMLYNHLKNKLNNLHIIKTTTLSNDDFYHRENTCKQAKIRLIFAGRISKIKGLLDILESMAILVDEGFDLEFKLVGMTDKKDPTLLEMKEKAVVLNISDRWEYIGYRTAGENLLQEYRKSDIFVIASQSNSEGFPRTIWEAMASSLPVVATKVSSIPMFTKGAAQLATPKDISSLTNSLRTVLENKQRRKEMITMGMELAKENTLEKRARELSELVISKTPVV